MAENILYHGFGFPVLLKGVAYKGEGPDRYLDIPHEQVSKLLLDAILRKPNPWTGAELRFVRKEMDLTQGQFAKLVHAKSYSNVVSWEGRENESTGLSEQAELYMRLRVVSELFGDARLMEFFHLFRDRILASAEKKPLEIQVSLVA